MSNATDLVVMARPGYLPPAAINWQMARLPDLYNAAVSALTKCEHIDECLEWSRQADAYASYYRQANDETMFSIAQRIKLRAIRRCGELFMSSGDSVAVHAERYQVPPQTLRVGKKLAAVPKATFEERIAVTPAPTVRETIGRAAAAERKAFSVAPDILNAMSLLRPHLVATPRVTDLVEEFDGEMRGMRQEIDAFNKLMIRLSAEFFAALNLRYNGETSDSREHAA